MVAIMSDNKDHKIKVVLFGPQVASFDKQSLDKLRESLFKDTSLHWIQDTVADLPRLWDAILESFPDLNGLPGKKILSDFETWLRNGVDKRQSDKKLPNIVMTPLVVIAQLTQYRRYLELNSKGVAEPGTRDLHASFIQQDVETLGFCTGLLSAFAVSCSYNECDLKKYGAVAIRLAMLIGAFVDVQDTYDDTYGRAQSYALAWNSDEQGAEMKRTIVRFPEAYISVQYDERRVTLTTREATGSTLLQQLKEVGITATEVRLQGRFHYAQYNHDVESLIQFCDSNLDFQFSGSESLALPTYANNGGEEIKGGKMHELALRAILVEQSKWYQTFAALQASKLNKQDSVVVSFGLDKFVPPSLMHGMGPRLIHFADLDKDAPQMAGVLDPEARSRNTQAVGDNDIAIVGMSIKVAGADDTNEFWEILSKGQSQHQEVPKSRIGFETHWRDLDTERKWYGNFLNDVDGFDHKFFKKSPREAASTDPQQRLMLQAAYQAVEQSGYFNLPSADAHVGCYIGVCSVDYEQNIACHPPNAFTATGNQRGFIAGKVSHYFGWTGPGITVDTACSSSGVAIHMGCRAILTGECNAALVGGVSTITNPLWFQNLAGATFLSPTGQCKPFDELADGYCRGEGIACVFLKKMTSAIADGNQIFGRIASTAVYQNQNCTPIFVPNSPSLSLLFGDVVRQAGLEPHQISLVEAHGTGTQVGDPAEYESIRLALAGPNVRVKPLPIGSVKGCIGHTEGASGMISLIKVLVMMQEGFIPPQASFSKISHNIKASASDMMEVVTTLKPWVEQYKAALINNYGASGSNASMVVTQSPQNTQESTAIHATGIKHPFWISALDERSIVEHCAKLIKYIKSEKASTKETTLADLSFNVCRQSNHSFARGLVFSCGSIDELKDRLTNASIIVKPVRPVILCFGGQVSTFVGLDRSVYENVRILRNHLDKCDSFVQSLGLDSIYPDIFQKTPIEDAVRLQVLLFSMQYSCAKSWMDCGVKVEAVVGHSFGEITALCIAGVLDLQDTIKLVVGRAKVVRDMWGEDRGAMMAIEGDETTLSQLLIEANERYDGEHQASIACYNGPRSFTVAGSTEVINIVDEMAQDSFSSLRRKKLNVTNAFHSSLVEPLLDSLEQVGRGLTFKKPIIRLERATETNMSSHEFTPRFVADHMRSPVFFNHALQRLAKDYASCIWLEAGSNSTITIMANRALGSSPEEQYFQAINLTNDRGVENLTDATVSLWKEGLRVSFWPHHPIQTCEYAPLLLPPYQFETSRHWLELKSPAKVTMLPAGKMQEETPLGLFTCVGYKDATNRSARFRVNTMTKEYEKFVSGHMIAQTAPICPATLEVDMAIEALFALRADYAELDLQPSVLNMINHSPICVDPSRFVWLDYELVDPGRNIWDWKIASTPDGSQVETQHVQGRIQFRAPTEEEYQSEFARFERLVAHKQCTALLEDDEADDIIQGRNVYESFAPVVDYGEIHRGVRKVVGRGNETAGRVCKSYTGETWFDAILSDCFSQVGGLWVNCMTDIDRADMYIASGCELFMRSPKVCGDYRRPSVWDVFARHHRETEKSYLTDVFVFDPTNGRLVEVILGILYMKIAKVSMRRILTRLTATDAAKAGPSAAVRLDEEITQEKDTSNLTTTTLSQGDTPKIVSNGQRETKTSRPDISEDVKNLIANVSGLEVSDIKDDSELADFGIDSLMGMELAREVETVFRCTLRQDQLIEATSFRKFVKCICLALYGPNNGDAGDDSTSTSDLHSDSNTPDDIGDEIATAASSPPTERVVVADSELKLSRHDILASFGESKMLTDKFIRDYKIDDFISVVFSESNKLCVALIVEAFEQLGCPLRTATKGQVLQRINYEPRHGRLVEYLYDFLETEARLIDVCGSQIVRTGITASKKSSEALLEGLLKSHPEWTIVHQLTHYAGKNLKDVLLGKTDGIGLIFGTAEGRRLVSGLYCDHPINKMGYEQMKDFIGRLVSRLPANEGPLKILEMGAGTGGTTQVLAPFLATLDVPVEYTFTDLSASMVAQARLKYGKVYPFMKFAVHDIEKPPAQELQGQHIVIASNAVHATHSLTVSGGHIHSALRSDGLLLMLEMTQILPHIELIFGLLEGWWLFDDGRCHAISDPLRWEQSLKSVGFGHVDYSDGSLPETDIQKVIVALASGPAVERLPKPEKLPAKNDVDARDLKAGNYVTKYSAGFCEPLPPTTQMNSKMTSGSVIFITGTTGSLGSHLVEQFSLRSDVEKIVCLNRYSKKPIEERQQEAFSSRGISLPAEAQAKLWVLDTNAAKHNLGLPESEYIWLTENVSHIIHNAWPMSGTRPIEAFEPHFHVLRILIDLAHAIASRRSGSGFRVNFQFVSSIGVVGHYPLWSGKVRVPEERMQMKSVLDSGYCEAKFTCERILDETLHKYPENFRPMAVRLGQIAGSRTSGFWNTVEHFSFLIKSSQLLKALPALDGVLQWVPVNDVARTLVDLSLSNSASYPIYHIDNPVGQPWTEMIKLLADALDIPRENIVPFQEWVKRVRRSPLQAETDNPAAKLIDFLDENFLQNTPRLLQFKGQ
ncbi:hypothetical protein ABKA04_000832 [Annulohypoxylon sp. FPYF3050]